MKVSQFYKEQRCPKLHKMEQFVGGNERRMHLKRILDMVVGLLGAGKSYSDIRHTVSESITETYAKIKVDFPWQRELFAKQDYVLFDRLLKWFEQNKYSVEKAFCAVSVPFENFTFSDGTSDLHSMVSLVMRDKQGRFYGMIIHTGKSKRSKGAHAKKVSTKASCDLYSLVAKYSLEETYPNIQICSVYLALDSDTAEEMAEEFVESETMTSNVHRLNYEDCYEDGTFQKEGFRERVLVVVKTAVEPENCSDCKVAGVCSIPQLYPCYEEKDKTGGYSLPGNFTDEQQEVVDYEEGPMRVCAGPGSGKTTTLVGRVKRLMEEGVSPEFILVVTYTSKAAEELKERCLTFLTEKELPTICTLHSLGFNIIKNCEELFDRPLNLLSGEGKMRLIENMLATRPQLKGFKYGLLKGKNGLYDTVSKRMDFYENCLKNDNESGFFEKYPEVGEDFVQFIVDYKECVKAQGYISFDDMITLCNQLFEEHPEILYIYQSVYKYIMVDEFQDANKEQVDLIYALAEKHHNLVIVGDDDQSIYSWRGGDPTFMLDFHKAFPETKDVVFTKNFRSTQAIVEAAKELIQRKQRRIAKDIVAGGKGGKGEPPVVIRSISTNVIETLITELVAGGYRYSDIAILSCNNKVLDRLHAELSVPTQLSKLYLHQDAFFMLLRSVIALHKDLDNSPAFYQFLRLYGHDYSEKTPGLSLAETLFAEVGIGGLEEMERKEDNPYFEVLSLLRDYLKILSETKNCYTFIKTLQEVAGWQKSDSPKVIKEQAEYRGIKDFDALLEYLNALAEYGTDSRVAEERGDNVLLITSFDAKGKEYKIALVVNDFYRDNMEECRNLFYVAMTRAEEGVFIFQPKEQGKKKADKFMDYLPDITHTVKEIEV